MGTKRNSGPAIQGIATVSMTAGIIISVILGVVVFILLVNANEILGFLAALLIIGVGSLFSWLSTRLLHGFGELVQYTAETATYLERIAAAQKSVNAFTAQQPVKASTDQQSAKASTDQQPAKASTDQQPVKASASQQPVKASAKTSAPSPAIPTTQTQTALEILPPSVAEPNGTVIFSKRTEEMIFCPKCGERQRGYRNMCQSCKATFKYKSE